MMVDNQTLRILQYNTQKSREVMAEAFSRHEIDDYDIIAIQEPYRNPFQHTTHHPQKTRFHLLYHNNGSTRTCFFINKRLAMNTWHVKFVNEDICTLRIRTPDRRQLCIYNIYNEPDAEGTTHTLDIMEQELRQEDPETHLLLLGDFNLHHPQWSGLRAQAPRREAYQLLDITQAAGLWQLTRKSIKTRRWYTGDTTIDLTFATRTLYEQLRQCTIAYSLDCDSDHLPVRTEFNWEWKPAPPRRTRRWAATDVTKLRETVERSIRHPNVTELTTPTELDNAATRLVHTLTEAIDQSTPWSNPSSHAMPGFDQGCKEACAETQRLRRRWQQSRRDDDWTAYKKARNSKSRKISRCLKQTHRSRITDAASTPHGIWRIAKWATTRQISPIMLTTPPLTREDGVLETNAERKANMFRDCFFPPPVQADLSDTTDFHYPNPQHCPPITASEIERAIQRTAPNKAPGPDGITNGILQKVLDLILPSLHCLFNASWKLGYFPRLFRESITVVLRKPGKDDYSQLKAYRPIALLNTIGKALEAVIGTRLMYLADKHHLLPSTHVGGRKMHSTEHAVHLLLEKIYEAWDEKKIASLLLLDVSGAFDNVSHPRLLHNLRKRRIDPTTLSWIASFLSDRVTTLVLPEYTAQQTVVHTGIPQGSPLSPIVYLFYNADLLEQCASDEVSTLGYIDDVSLLAIGKTPQHNTLALKLAHRKAEDWARKYGSVFAVPKYTLVHFTKNSRIDTLHPLRLPAFTVTPTSSCRYLGLQMDGKLNWQDHVKRIQQRASKRLTALSSIASSTWGASAATLRQVYQAMILPQLLYGCSAWYRVRDYRRPNRPIKNKSHTAHHLEPVQRRAAQIITGAFRTTAANAADVEAHLLPMDQQMERTTLHTTVRLLSSAVFDSAEGDIKSPLRHHARVLEKHYKINRSKLEHRMTNIITPWWTPPVVTIDNDEKDAISHHDELCTKTDTVCVYTDGSGIHGHTGAAAVILLHPNTLGSPLQQKRIQYTGKATENTVYTAELQGVLMALQILQEMPATPIKANLFTDNQNVLKTIRNPGDTPAQYILRDILDTLKQVLDRQILVEFRWIPAHQGVPGNEAADKAAKEAALQSLVLPLDTNKTLLAVAKRAISDSLTEDWKWLWKNGTHGRHLSSIGIQPNKKNLTIRQNLPRGLSSIITQMRTGKIGLRAYLHSINRADNKQCQCNYGDQTVEHVLLKCRNWTTERQEMWAGGRPRTNLREVLNDPKMVVRAAKMMLKTGLLEQFTQTDPAAGTSRQP